MVEPATPAAHATKTAAQSTRALGRVRQAVLLERGRFLPRDTKIGRRLRKRLTQPVLESTMLQSLCLHFVSTWCANVLR